MQLVIASFNTHKIHELRRCFRALLPECCILSFYDFPQFKPNLRPIAGAGKLRESECKISDEERLCKVGRGGKRGGKRSSVTSSICAGSAIGCKLGLNTFDPKLDSFEENAKAKALHAAKELNMYTLADDSGLVVPKLGQTGSALLYRYRHEKDSAIKQTKHLLDKISSFTEEERYAYLECALSLASPEGVITSVSQRTEGSLTEEERGKITFEFDTIFVRHGYRKTLGELSPSVRARVSHRKKALERILPQIEKLEIAKLG